MNYSSPQSVPLDFEPDFVYLVFIMRDDHPCAGVFHHNSDNRGILAYADVETPGQQRSQCKVFSFELKNRIETQFTIAAALKLASLHYHEWLPNETFASSEFVDENLWMTSVLRRLDTKWERKKLIWENRPWAEPSEYKKLARVHVPSVLFLTQAFYLRQLETGCAGPLKRRDT